MFLWSLNIVLMKKYVVSSDENFPPFLFNTLRFSLAGFLCILTLILTKKEWKISVHDFFIIGGLCIMGIGIYQIFYIFGLDHLKAGSIAIVISSIPVLVIMLTCIFKDSRWTKRKIISSILAVGGIIICAADDLDFSQLNIGVLYIFIAASSWALYIVFSKSTSTRLGNIRTITWFLVWGAILSTLIAAIAGELEFNQLPAADSKAWIAMFYSGIGSLYIGYILYQYAITNIGSEKTAQFSYLGPPLGLILSWLILSEMISIAQIIGMSIIFIAVYLSQKKAADESS